MKRIPLAVSTSIFCLFSILSFAQVAATTDTGPLPFHAYSGGKFDHVQLQNGSLFFSIPILSFPQLGKAELTFSLSGHSSSASPSEVCDAWGCTHGYADQDSQVIEDSLWGEYYTGNLRIQHDQAVSLASRLVESQVGNGVYDIRKHWSLREGSGLTHQLGYDSTDYSLLQATDGSGWIVKLPISNSPSAVFAAPSGSDIYAYDADGRKYTLNIGVSTVQDPNGNAIASVPDHHNGSLYANGLLSLTDSINRAIPLINNASRGVAVSTANCPDLGISDQPLTASYLWNVPGPNGNPQTYQLCYAALNLATNYWGYGGTTTDTFSVYDENGTFIGTGIDSWNETSGSTTVLQSVLLPDHHLSSGYSSFWGFVYDSPGAGSADTYGDIVEIRTPEGGRVHYNYTLTTACGASVPSPSATPMYPRVRSVANRLASSASGSSISTSYTYSATQTTETTAGNDTVHIFTLDNPPNYCGANETETKFFQGSSTATTPEVLKDVATTYLSVPSPQDNFPSASPAPFVDVRPYQVTTQVTGQDTNTTSYSYEPLFIDVDPVWNGSSGYTQASQQPTIYFTKSKAINDGLKTESTPFYWVSHPTYKAANLLNLPASDEILEIHDGVSTRHAYKSFGYDESNGSPSGALGNLTSTSFWVGAGRPMISNSSVYDSTGQIIQITDPMGVVTHIDSTGCYGLFPASVTAAFGTALARTSTQSHDCVTGAILGRNDVNGVVTSIDRSDPIGRVTKIRTAVNRAEETHTAYSYPQRVQVNVSQDKDVVDDGVLTSSQIYDGFGRMSVQIAPGNIAINTSYDNEGNVASISNPNAPGSGLADRYTTFLYDALGRRTVQCNQDNGTGTICSPSLSFKRWTYLGNQVTVRDEDGNQTVQTFDSLGRLTQVTEASGGSTASYAYDVLDNLTDVIQTDPSTLSVRTRHFSYDGLSRLITSSNPETGPICYGQWSGSDCINGYDPNGNLRAKTDARGVVVSNSYDALNRMTTHKVSGGGTATSSSCYVYDFMPGVTNGIGHLLGEWTQSGDCPSTPTAIPSSGVLTSRRITSYDALGRVKGEIRCALGRCNTSTPQSYVYDLAGDLGSYNDGRGVSSFLQSFDTAGRLQGVQSLSGNVQSSILNILQYDPVGWSKAILGNTMTQERTFDNRMRPLTNTVKAGVQ